MSGTGTTITPRGLGDVFRSLIISDDSAYKQQIQGAKNGVDEALVGVNTANRQFAVKLLAKCIQRETGIPSSALPEVEGELNAHVDGLVRANISQSQLEKKEQTLQTIVDELRDATKNTYQQGLDHIKKNEGLLELLVDLKVENTVGTPGFDNPFATPDDLEEAVIAKIKNS